MNTFGFLIVAIIILVFVLCVFAIVDSMLKKSPKTEKTPTKSVKEKAETPAIPKEETPPVMQFYNTHLADDLNEILENTNKDNNRLQIENHLNKKGNVAKYIQSKNYHGFNFETEDAPTEVTKDELTFTQEDYKRIMALSNIDDRKPL